MHAEAFKGDLKQLQNDTSRPRNRCAAEVSLNSTVVAHVSTPCCYAHLPQMALVSPRNAAAFVLPSAFRAIAMSISTRFESVEAPRVELSGCD